MKKSIIDGLVLLATVVLMGNVQAAPVSGQGTWETTLQARDLDGNGVTDAFYDAVLNIIWLDDANGATNWLDALHGPKATALVAIVTGACP